MKKMDYQNVRGTRDYLPKDEVIRRYIKRTLEDVFIQYGCKPLETPILNYTDLLASKYGGGAEILEEMYTLTDRGERDLALRYDLTIPFAKVVGLNPTLSMPFKRYEIGKVFRDGPIKTGRLREFTQCDVDVVGVASQVAEAELIMMALDIFEKLGLKVQIQFNNRKLLVGLLKLFETPADKINRAVLTIDKLEKVGLGGVLEELKEQALSESTIASLGTFLAADNNDRLEYYEPYMNQSEQVKEGIEELTELMSYLAYLGIDRACVFNPTLARGLEIYTGTIYEVFLSDGSIQSSIGSGGRYNNAIAGLIGTDEEIATVGISFGLDVIYTAMSNDLSEVKECAAIDYYIIPMDRQKEGLLVAGDLRRQGYKVEVEMSNRKLRRALDKANKEGIRNVIIIGENEVESNSYKVKDMVVGDERLVAFNFSNKSKSRMM